MRWPFSCLTSTCCRDWLLKLKFDGIEKNICCHGDIFLREQLMKPFELNFCKSGFYMVVVKSTS